MKDERYCRFFITCFCDSIQKSTGISKTLVREFFGYIWVGASAFIIDAGILLILVEFQIYYILANSASFLIANAFNFWASHNFVFRKKTRLPTLIHTYVAVLAISIAGLLLNNSVLFIGVELLTLSILVAKIVATIASLLWNFAARKLLVYS